MYPVFAVQLCFDNDTGVKSKKSLCKSRIEVDNIANAIHPTSTLSKYDSESVHQVCVATTIGLSSDNSDDAHDDGKVFSLYKYNKGVS